MTALQAEFRASIDDFPAAQWDALFGGVHPFTRHAFLAALEHSGAAAAASGWQPAHLALSDAGGLVAAMPLYVKSHSYGEFVFDWSWAEAYRRSGFSYYPKLVSAVPFSPVAGPRLGMASGRDPEPVIASAFAAVRRLAAEQGQSGWHLLFPEPELQQHLRPLADSQHLLRREAVQFQWRNAGYRDFGQFLDTLRAARRKNLRRERRRVAEQGVELWRLGGEQIDDEDWRFFYACYRSTYEKRSGHGGYLGWDFFQRLRAAMPERLLLVLAGRAGRRVASALFLHDRERLYGRYWGALEQVDCLHFETCLYQGIEYCIERGLSVFDPGTQGEHKLMRGFEPVRSASYHWLADGRFHAALGEWLEREHAGVASYELSAREFLPFRKIERDG